MSTQSPSERQHNGISLLSLTLFMGVGYGAVLTIYVQCLFLLVHSPMRRAPRLFFFGYTTAMFILETLYAAENSRRVWISFVINWDSTTSPTGYEISLWRDWASIAAMACYIVSNWLADALMLWRCIILFRNMKNTRWLIPVPCSMFLAVIATSINLLVNTAEVSNSIEAMSKAYCIFVVVDLSFNIITTLLIAACIMIHRAKLEKSTGSRRHGREYTSIITMTTESCMISAISSIVYLVLYTMDNFVQYPFMVIQSQMQIIAPFILISRILQGKAWTDVDIHNHLLPSDIEDFPSSFSGLITGGRSSERSTLVFGYRNSSLPLRNSSIANLT
ncbi:hypothetical protein DEU56DRAFT_749539 [Suillus clintonianus]|uniref:uncharacterized protein n=1 Tax=Suillus clintonianus TaxID=1904413 RepID=UPI001B87D8AB|nr:uncharacterized protein DEU56DRAFT_749539 [Suillus clintonianus]KAG2111735.1 hypothetical protein DEU56DRAFT_749539 [Suillus clintonianus]